MNKSIESHQRLLTKLHLCHLFVCLAFLLVGVPFFFVNKLTVVVILLLVMAFTVYCGWLAKNGRTQSSLKRFSLLIWWIVIPMLYLGQLHSWVGYYPFRSC